MSCSALADEGGHIVVAESGADVQGHSQGLRKPADQVSLKHTDIGSRLRVTALRFNLIR